ncbi:MAG: hypothetical protein ACXVCE_02525, partial [Bacteriovorax sp.]
MKFDKFIPFFCFTILMAPTWATDLSQVVSGGEVEDSLGNVNVKGPSPYIIHSSDEGAVESQAIKKNAEPDFVFSTSKEDITVKNESKKKLEDFGYTPPGTFEKKENYIELDKKELASDYRKHSAGGINLTFIKNDYSYESENDVINKTISEGYKHVKGGALYIRSDQYFFRRDFVNSY